MRAAHLRVLEDVTFGDRIEPVGGSPELCEPRLIPPSTSPRHGEIPSRPRACFPVRDVAGPRRASYGFAVSINELAEDLA
jgi:hypothetical protein